MLNINVGGIVNKITDLHTFLLSHCTHVVAMAEACLSSDISRASIVPHYYKMVRNHVGPCANGVANNVKTGVGCCWCWCR